MTDAAPATDGGLRRRDLMPLADHLRELRRRIVRVALALALGSVVGYAAFPPLLEVLLRPYCTATGAGGCELIVLSPLDPFFVRLRSAVVLGLVLGLPVLLHQAWRFVRPGLERRERRIIRPFVVLSPLLFAGGIAFAAWVIPRGLRILLELGGTAIEPMLGAREYLAFLLGMGLAFGVVFQLPLVLSMLALTGVVTADGMRRFRRYAIVGNVVLAAVITPTGDAVTLLLVAAPMLVFYELAILLARLLERSRRRRTS